MEHSAIKRVIALTLSFMLMLLPLENALAGVIPISGKDNPMGRALKAKIDSGDVIVSEKARQGSSVVLLQDPRKHAAGEPITLTIIGIYTAWKALAPYISGAANGVTALKIAANIYKAKLIAERDYPNSPEQVQTAIAHQFAVESLEYGLGEIQGKGIEFIAKEVGKTVVKEFGKTIPLIGDVPQIMDMWTLAKGSWDLTKTVYEIAIILTQNDKVTLEIPDTGTPMSNLTELIKNNEFSNSLLEWQYENAFVSSSFGPIGADPHSSFDNSFAVTHTGWGDQSTRGYLEQQVNVPMSRTGAFSILYNFVTTEYPTFQGSEFNDYFQLTLSGPSGELVTKVDYLNSSNFQSVSGLPASILDQTTGGQTGWLFFNQSGLLLKQGIYKLRIEVNDVTDPIYDSAILVDRVNLK